LGWIPTLRGVSATSSLRVSCTLLWIATLRRVGPALHGSVVGRRSTSPHGTGHRHLRWPLLQEITSASLACCKKLHVITYPETYLRRLSRVGEASRCASIGLRHATLQQIQKC
jgi:hypothetical protein